MWEEKRKKINRDQIEGGKTLEGANQI